MLKEIILVKNLPLRRKGDPTGSATRPA